MGIVVHIHCEEIRYDSGKQQYSNFFQSNLRIKIIYIGRKLTYISYVLSTSTTKQRNLPFAKQNR